MPNENEHRAHPVRNFFYVLYSFINLAAFLGFFYGFYAISMPKRTWLLIATGAVLVCALFFGALYPLFRSRRTRKRRW